MNKALLFFVTASLISFAGCHITSQVTLTTDKVHEPLSNPNNVKVYLFDEKPHFFEEIGVIEVFARDSVRLLINEAVETARDKACEIGANCIIFIKDFFNSGKHQDNNRFVFRAGRER